MVPADGAAPSPPVCKTGTLLLRQAGKNGAYAVICTQNLLLRGELRYLFAPRKQIGVPGGTRTH